MSVARAFQRTAVVLSSALTLATSACVTVHRPSYMMPESHRAWRPTFDWAQLAAARGRFDAADSALAAFATRYPGTHEALETAYWRALFALDPANRGVSLTSALASLDAYLSDQRPREHVAEATSLRRLAGQLDVLTKLAATSAAPKEVVASATTRVTPEPSAKPAEPVNAAAADAEIKRLKDELAKANAELERIRKRLNQPPKP